MLWHGNVSFLLDARQPPVGKELYEANFKGYEIFEAEHNLMKDRVPFINFSGDLDQAIVDSQFSLVIETYFDWPDTIAFSEKIFRALCLPAPWITWAGKYTVAHLRSLGFDTLHDIIDHKYDSAIELKTATWGDKLTDFVFESIDIVNRFQQRDQARLKSRCIEAAEHNQKLLAEMQHSWPRDFANWLPGLLDKLK